jgi:hypothetical protein
MEAVPHLERLALFTVDRDRRASIFLVPGQLLEQAKHPDQALPYYREGLSTPASDPRTLHFLNNNLAFCLCSLGRHIEAEPYARERSRSIPTDTTRTRIWRCPSRVKRATPQPRTRTLAPSAE